MQVVLDGYEHVVYQPLIVNEDPYVAPYWKRFSSKHFNLVEGGRGLIYNTFWIIGTDITAEQSELSYFMGTDPETGLPQVSWINVANNKGGNINGLPTYETLGFHEFDYYVTDGIGTSDSLKVTIYVAPKDVDNDLIPDTWEIANFGNIDVSSNIEDDSDGDGDFDIDEYFFGSDPQDPNDFFDYTFHHVGSNYELSFDGIAGRTYTLQYIDPADPNNAIEVETVDFSKDESVTVVFTPPVNSENANWELKVSAHGVDHPEALELANPIIPAFWKSSAFGWTLSVGQQASTHTNWRVSGFKPNLDIGQLLEFTKVDGPDWIRINYRDGKLESFNGGPTAAGSYTVILQVKHPEGEPSQATVTITVN